MLLWRYGAPNLWCLIPLLKYLFINILGFVKFFGNLAIMDSPQQICERYPVFLEKVFEMADSQDPTMIGVAVDTVGILGSSVEGKQVLQKTGWCD